jgi:hypothetical protein
MVRMFTKTLAMSLTVLGLTSTLALAQPSSTNASPGMRESTGIANSAGTSATYSAEREDPSWHQSWNHVGSGGSNVGLHNGKNPYAEPLEPSGFNNPGADYSGYSMQNRS